MRHIVISLFCSVVLLSTAGCANYSFDMNSLWGTSTLDLEKARTNGVDQTFDVPYDKLFAATIDTLKANKLVIFQQNVKKQYIVAMGFPKQTDTTRVGIFFTPSEGKTTVTLSSLSSTALAKAKDMIFKGLEKTLAGPTAAGTPASSPAS